MHSIEHKLDNIDYSDLEKRVLALYAQRFSKSMVHDADIYGTGIRGKSVAKILIDEIAELDRITLHKELEQSNPFNKRVTLTPEIKEALSNITVLSKYTPYRTSNINTHGSCTGRIYNPLDHFIGI